MIFILKGAKMSKCLQIYFPIFDLIFLSIIFFLRSFFFFSKPGKKWWHLYHCLGGWFVWGSRSTKGWCARPELEGNFRWIQKEKKDTSSEWQWQWQYWRHVPKSKQMAWADNATVTSVFVVGWGCGRKQWRWSGTKRIIAHHRWRIGSHWFRCFVPGTPRMSICWNRYVKKQWLYCTSIAALTLTLFKC